jgi:hypothetical protein
MRAEMSVVGVEARAAKTFAEGTSTGTSPWLSAIDDERAADDVGAVDC